MMDTYGYDVRGPDDSAGVFFFTLYSFRKTSLTQLGLISQKSTYEI